MDRELVREVASCPDCEVVASGVDGEEFVPEELVDADPGTFTGLFWDTCEEHADALDALIERYFDDADRETGASGAGGNGPE